MNEGGSSGDKDTRLTQRRSWPVQFELIDKDGNRHGWYATAEEAAKFAKSFWPDQSQDPDRTGKGWDVQITE